MTTFALGNDIVDLVHDAEVREGFADRILHPEERRRLPKSLSARTVWCHWAAKEAAFKAFKQGDLSRRHLQPRHWLYDQDQGSVRFEDQEWSIDIRDTGDFIHAIARSENRPYAERIFESARDLTPDEQKTEAKRLLNELCALYAPDATLHRTDEGVPFLIDQGERRAFSISHHARHVAVVLALPYP